MDIDNRKRAFEVVERATDLPMLVLSVTIIPLLVVPYFVSFSPSMERTLFTIDWLIWAVFAMELALKTYLAPSRVRYLKENWFDVVFVAVPFLRPLRVVRSVRLLRSLRAARAISLFAKVSANGRQIFVRHGLQYALLTGLIAIVGCAAATLYFERESGGNIDDFGTALWWAATTVTTVGYGDTYPTTAEGRGVAVFLMLIGITLFSVLTANIAAFFIEADRTGPTLDDVMAKLESIEKRLDESN